MQSFSKVELYVRIKSLMSEIWVNLICANYDYKFAWKWLKRKRNPQKSPRKLCNCVLQNASFLCHLVPNILSREICRFERIFILLYCSSLNVMNYWIYYYCHYQKYKAIKPFTPNASILFWLRAQRNRLCWIWKFYVLCTFKGVISLHLLLT